MWGVLKRNPYAVIFAVLLHLGILFFLIFGVDWATPEKPATPKVNVVQAHTVEADKLPPTVAEKQQAEAQKRLKREAEVQRKKIEKQKQEQKRLAEQKARKEKQAAEQKRKAQAEAKRKAENKRLAEAKRKAEAEKKRKADAEAKRKAEAEAKRKAEAKRRADEQRRRAEAEAQAERERALQAQIAAEQNSREIDRYVAVIKQQIERSWLKPAASSEGLSCEVQVRLIPGGDVIPGGVSIIRSSGNDAFDRSVETAVYKSAPLPVPSGALFESFRVLKLNFKPNK
ncbi:MAG: cell envelope integrity protein TolA [Candidatus Thiodiazotropha sp.]|jgi:colicin import membrane protein